MKRTYKDTRTACFAASITQAISINLAPILFVIFQDRFGLSLTLISQLIFMTFGIQLITDLLAVKYVDKIGYRKAASLAHFFSALGLVCLGILPVILPSAYAGLLIAVTLYAFGSGLLEVLTSPIVDALPSDDKAGSMSLLHSFYCWGQMGVVLLSSLALKVFGNGVWFWLPIVWAIVPFLNMFNFATVPLPESLSAEHHAPFSKLFVHKLFITALILMVCGGAAELVMSQWASLFAQKGLHVSKFTGDLLGPCLFAFFMGLGRTLYGIFGQRINLKAALAGCAVLCTLCYTTAVFAHNPILSLAACALTGLSVSLFWPGVLSLSSATFPTGGTAMFALLALFGDVGCSVGPWLAGMVSDLSEKSARLVSWGAANGLTPEQTGLRTGLFLAVIFPLTILVCLGILSRRKKGPNQ